MDLLFRPIQVSYPSLYLTKIVLKISNFSENKNGGNYGLASRCSFDLHASSNADKRYHKELTNCLAENLIWFTLHLQGTVHQLSAPKLGENQHFLYSTNHHVGRLDRVAKVYYNGMNAPPFKNIVNEFGNLQF